MYNPDGSTKKVVQPGKAFFKPSDMVELKDGQFAVRDNNGIQIFSDEGKFNTNSLNYLHTVLSGYSIKINGINGNQWAQSSVPARPH